MKSIEIIKDELVDDTVDTCLQDSSYLRSIVKDYFKAFNEKELRKMHEDAFEDTE